MVGGAPALGAGGACAAASPPATACQLGAWGANMRAKDSGRWSRPSLGLAWPGFGQCFGL